MEATIVANENRLPDVVLSRIKRELKSGNSERAYLGLEEWFQVERRYIGEAAKLLAQHYASYWEPEIARDAVAKARRAASVAVGCLDDSREMAQLIDEILLFVAELSSGTEEVQAAERELDVVQDFVGPHLMYEAMPRIEATYSAAKRQLEQGRYRLAILFIRRAATVSERVLPPHNALRLAVSTTLAEILWLSGEEAEAESILREIVRVGSALGDEHTATLSGRSLLAWISHSD